MTSITINAPASKVWSALTKPDLRKQWFFGVDTDTDWKPGSPIVHRGQWQGKPYEDKGTIRTVEPERRLVHTHWSSMSGRPDRPENYETIDYRLSEKDGATTLEVTEDNVADEKQRATSEEMWRKALGELKRLAEAR